MKVFPSNTSAQITRYLNIFYSISGAIKNEETGFADKYLDSITDIDSFCTALFIKRDIIKQATYTLAKSSEDFELLTNKYMVYDRCFFRALARLKSGAKKMLPTSDDSAAVRRFVLLTIEEIRRNTDKEQKTLTGQEAARFYYRTLMVSSLHEDLHTYTIQDPNLSDYLEENGISFEKNLEIAYKSAGDFFYRGVGPVVIRSLQKYNIKNDFGIFIIEKRNYLRLKQKTKDLLDAFSTDLPATDEENNQLVFCCKNNDFVYIAPNVMSITIEIIEKCMGWGQYKETLTHFGVITDNKVLEQTQRTYNKLMTYKIADYLKSEGYTLPALKKNGRMLPQVEINAFKGRKNSEGKDYGDIDILFFSPYTQNLYLIEYKNYCMTVSNSGSISKDCNKAKNANAFSKSMQRRDKAAEDIAALLSKVNLHIDANNISDVKSVILTTKPNAFYFRKEGQDEKCLFYDWIDFREEIKKKTL